MRYDQDHESSDLIDERGQGGPRLAGGSGLLGLLPLLLRFRFGWVIIVVVLGYTFVRNFVGAPTRSVAGTAVSAKGGDAPRHFVAFRTR